eukprot:2506968-Pleurochrysis_carterae.AAC.1
MEKQFAELKAALSAANWVHWKLIPLQKPIGVISAILPWRRQSANVQSRRAGGPGALARCGHGRTAHGTDHRFRI